VNSTEKQNASSEAFFFALRTGCRLSDVVWTPLAWTIEICMSSQVNFDAADVSRAFDNVLLNMLVCFFCDFQVALFYGVCYLSILLGLK
jgi:hypothetical protein